MCEIRGVLKTEPRGWESPQPLRPGRGEPCGSIIMVPLIDWCDIKISLLRDNVTNRNLMNV